MLTVVNKVGENKKYQKIMQEKIGRTLAKVGKRKLGYQGGNVEVPVLSAGEGKLWFASRKQDTCFWNVFGKYESKKSNQSIIVEINIPTTRSARPSGFFAKDRKTSEIMLMHEGRIRGGRHGIGKSAFLAWTKRRLVQVIKEDGASRLAFVVAPLNDINLVDQIWEFVRHVDEFKAKAKSGDLNTAEFHKEIQQCEEYVREFSGKKRGWHGGHAEYDVIHGKVVDALFTWRNARLRRGEVVTNNQLIDLYVRKDGALTEVYEVKTSANRQVLYTAIGQALTHALGGGRQATKKILVIPKGKIPKDMERALKTLGIEVMRYSATKRGGKTLVKI